MPNSNDDEALMLRELVDRQSKVIEEMHDRLEALERRNSEALFVSSTEALDGLEPQVSRRKLLFGAMAAAAGAAIAIDASPAAALTGQNVVLGASNDANLTTSLTNTAASTPAAVLSVTNGATGSAIVATGTSEGINGTGGGADTAAGVAGTAASGYGLYGASTSGYAIFAGGNGRIGLGSHLAAGPPISGSYAAGDLVRDAGGNTFSCVTAGSPGVWRKVAGPASAGAFHFLTPARRVIDTRNDGGLLTNSFRTVPLAPWVPANALAIAANLTVIHTNSYGWGTLYSPATGPGGSSINWDHPAATIANFAMSPISGQSVNMRIDGTANFIIDVIGYFL